MPCIVYSTYVHYHPRSPEKESARERERESALEDLTLTLSSAEGPFSLVASTSCDSLVVVVVRILFYYCLVFCLAKKRQYYYYYYYILTSYRLARSKQV